MCSPRELRALLTAICCIFFCKRSIFLINIIYQIGFIFQLFVLVVCNHKKSAIRFGYSNEMGNDTI